MGKKIINDLWGFDDVILAPNYVSSMGDEISLATKATNNIPLALPIILDIPKLKDAHKAAIAIAKIGGIGVIPMTDDIGQQVEEVRKVKRFTAYRIYNPIKVFAETIIAEAKDLMDTYGISGIPVVEPGDKLVGLVTKKDMKKAKDVALAVSTIMTPASELITGDENISPEDIKAAFEEHNIGKLPLVDMNGICRGLVTLRDIKNLSLYPDATKDDQGRLRVGAMIEASDKGIEHVRALSDCELDMVIVDVNTGSIAEMINVVKKIRSMRSTPIQVVGGNISTVDEARALLNAGADGIRVGALKNDTLYGIGVPALSSLMSIVDEAKRASIPVISVGHGDIMSNYGKALAAGAEALAIGKLLDDKTMFDEALNAIKAVMNRTGSSSLRDLRSNAQFIQKK